MTIEDIAKTFPNANFTISASDLITYSEKLVNDTMAKTREEERSREKDIELISDEDAREIFGVTSATLWRWRKRGYLEGVPVGGRIKYRRCDCMEKLKAKR